MVVLISKIVGSGICHGYLNLSLFKGEIMHLVKMSLSVRIFLSFRKISVTVPFLKISF